MGFVERAVTPPGTGGREAQAIIAQAEANDAIKAAQAKLSQMTQLSGADAPKPPKAAAPPPLFAAQQQQATKTATVLGSKAVAGEQSRKTSVLG